MGLPPLEYIDCFLDSPTFREIITLYEKELETNSAYVKTLVKECRHMITATEEFSRVQQSFAQVLGNFRFQTIGDQTEDEKMITNSLQTFARLLFSIEDCRHNMLSTISVRLLQTLERFRKDQIQKAKDEKKKFDRSSERYYQALDKHLGYSAKRKEHTLAEADSLLEREHAGFRQAAFDYVCKLQDVHAQKQYELIEPILGYISDVTTFLHQAYDSATSIKPELNAVQFKVQILRERHLEEQEKAYELKAQVIEECESGVAYHPEFLHQGNLHVQDAKKAVGLGLGWHRYFCQFKKDKGNKGKSRFLRLTPTGHHGLMPLGDLEVKDCIRSRTEDVDRRFCFEVELYTNSTKTDLKKYVVQCRGNEERKGWLEVMEGKEPVYTSLKVIEIGGVTPQGFVFVQKCISIIEARGLDEEGLYRKPGVLSKANKLVKDAIERGKVDSMDIGDEFEWDTKTIASAVKNYFSKQLGEPLLTFRLHREFIEAAKIADKDKRVEAVRELLEQLPEAHRKILILLIEHLNRIALQSDRNLMKASNLGVVFGPTLMRPERETVASIVDIKYQNIIVEMMIDNIERIFSETKQSSGEEKRKKEVDRPQGSPEPPPPPIEKRATEKVFPGANHPGPPPAHEPPSRPLPPLPPNPNIPPPPITHRPTPGGRKPSKSPEPYQDPVKALQEMEKKRPPVPRNKPQIPDTSLKRRTYMSPSDGGSFRQPVNRSESLTTADHRHPVNRSESSHQGEGVPNFSRTVSTRETRERDRDKREISPLPPPRPWRQQPPPGRNARALYDCDAEDSLELSFKKDEILYQVMESQEPEWLEAARADGRKGLVPANYVELLP